MCSCQASCRNHGTRGCESAIRILRSKEKRQAHGEPALHRDAATLLGGGFGLDPSLLAQSCCLVGRFPGEVCFLAAKVAIGSRLTVDGTAKIQALDDSLRS